ncbi:MAG: DUF5714 domain-containing protein [Clostridiales bacterium]
MFLAKNNILVKIKNSKSSNYYTILNPISGSFDLMNQNDYDKYLNFFKNKSGDLEFRNYLIERGYLFNSKEEHDTSVKIAYDEFNEEIKNSQIQLMLIPTYSCNLDCTYCFQHGIEGKPKLISKETVDDFFKYANNNFSNVNVKPFITLFGGEPLINSTSQRSIIEYILSKCIEFDYELSIVTNGYDLINFIDMLKRVKIKEIQITIDGTKETHDSRRYTKNRKGTFDRIVDGVNKAIELKMPINLRTVADRENIESTVKMAEFLDGLGWLDLSQELFKTQIGRNYELFECYDKSNNLMSQVELWSEYSYLSKKYPVLSKLHRPDFKGVRHIVDTGEMYMASFDTCPACKTEWVFDLYGDIYGCTASCGREEYKLGEFSPKTILNLNEIQKWKNRDVLSIEKCKECEYDVICGGGCGVVAGNKNDRDILKPDCRPIQELFDIGINHYIDEIEDMSDNTEIKIGCNICGSDILYNNFDTDKKCEVCGVNYKTKSICQKGHFVCDKCHSGSILEKIKNDLIKSDIENPIKLAEKIFSIPGLKMHGPEYHGIVPGVIIAAWLNITKSKDYKRVIEAFNRGMDIKGGNCGFCGNCGAGVGAGIAEAVINETTPMSKKSRGIANRATAHALFKISEYDGPRCCKRESILTIESFMENSEYFKDIMKKYKCIQFSENKDCIGKKCPYFPR